MARKRHALRDIARFRRRFERDLKRIGTRPHTYHTPTGWHLTSNGEIDARLVRLWMRDMFEWGKLIRQDILRLEAAASLPANDPGDPPPEPQ